MKSQRQKILARLKSGKSITQLQALEWYGCMRLGAIIFELKEQYPYIITEMIPVKNRFKQTVYVARYLL